MESKEFFDVQNKERLIYVLISFQTCTLFGMWLIPTLLSLKNFWWRFVIIWACFTLVTGVMMKRAMEKPVHVSTPR